MAFVTVNRIKDELKGIIVKYGFKLEDLFSFEKVNNIVKLTIIRENYVETIFIEETIENFNKRLQIILEENER